MPKTSAQLERAKQHFNDLPDDVLSLVGQYLLSQGNCLQSAVQVAVDFARVRDGGD